MKKKIRLFRGLDNDIALRIYAVILAVLIWFIMSVTLYPTKYKTISNVPVKIITENTLAEDYSLEPINYTEPEISVRIKGMNYEIGNYTADDLVASLVITSDVNKAGEYDLDVKVEAKNGADFDVISISSPTIKVRFDTYSEKEFVVTAEAPNIKADEGYYRESPVCVPNIIKISGPKQDIDKIDKVVIKTSDTPVVLNESKSFSDNSIILYSGSTILDNNLFKFNNENFSIEVPIFMKKTLSFKLDLTNFPKKFDENSLKFTLSPSTIELAAPNALLADLDEIHLGYLDMRKIDLDSVIEIPLSLQTGYQNLSGVYNITATFNTEGYTSKIISIEKSQIYIVNKPSKYDISVLSNGISKVKVIGPKDIIDKLTSADIIAEVDILNSNITDNTNTLAASVYSPTYNNIWAYGEYTVALDVKEKE